MIFLVYYLQKLILIYLPMKQKYIFLTHLRVNNFFYKIILIYFHNGQINCNYICIIKMYSNDFKKGYSI